MPFPLLDTRDAGLRKLSRINRWLIAGSATLTGGLSEVAAQAFPGKAEPATTTKFNGTSVKSSSSSSKTSTSSLKPPAQAPKAASESTPAKEESTSEKEATNEGKESPTKNHPDDRIHPAKESTPTLNRPALRTALAKESAPAVPEVAGSALVPAPAW